MRLVSFPFHSDTIGAHTKDQSVSSDRSSNGPENLSPIKQQFHRWICDGGLEAPRNGRSDYAQDSTWYAWLGYRSASASNAELLHALRQIMADLPSKKDWLDPQLEQFAIAAIAKATGGQQ